MLTLRAKWADTTTPYGTNSSTSRRRQIGMFYASQRRIGMEGSQAEHCLASTCTTHSALSLPRKQAVWPSYGYGEDLWWIEDTRCIVIVVYDWLSKVMCICTSLVLFQLYMPVSPTHRAELIPFYFFNVMHSSAIQCMNYSKIWYLKDFK
jgi:hypothetical protein